MAGPTKKSQQLQLSQYTGIRKNIYWSVMYDAEINSTIV